MDASPVREPSESLTPQGLLNGSGARARVIALATRYRTWPARPSRTASALASVRVFTASFRRIADT